MKQPIDIIVPSSEISTINCDYCQQSISVHIVQDAVPHMYCSNCNNVYHERYEEDYDKRFRLTPFLRKKMHHVEAHAPHCLCGGLFLFNAHPRCPKCRNYLPLAVKPDSKERFLYSDMMVFDGTEEYVDQGPNRLYRFS